MKRVFVESKGYYSFYGGYSRCVEWLSIPEEEILGFRFLLPEEEGENHIRVEVITKGNYSFGLLIAQTFKDLEEAQKWVRESFPGIAIAKFGHPEPEPTKTIRAGE